MAAYDLTHPLNNKTPVFPGERRPCIRDMAYIEHQGYREKWLELATHTGTHVDAPAHLFPNGETLDRFPVSRFTGIATVITIPTGTQRIEKKFLEQYIRDITESGYVLLVTGWSRFWGQETYFHDFPVLSEDAAAWLVTHHLKGIGLDTISADPVDSVDLPVHRILLGAGLLIIENLIFPEDFKVQTATFYCFPLNLTDADGSPVRAVAVKSEK